jgi:hypothetical protein
VRAYLVKDQIKYVFLNHDTFTYLFYFLYLEFFWHVHFYYTLKCSYEEQNFQKGVSELVQN